jgi:uncharacterized membrane protein YeiB
MELVQSTAPLATVAPATTRQLGLDVARAVAILGMLFAHFATSGLDGATGWTTHVARFNDGRAMPLFVMLSGAGFVLLLRRSPRPNREVMGRAAVLLLVGLTFEYTTPIAVILQFYALFFVVALVVRTLPNRWLLVGAVAVVIIGAVTTLHLNDHLPVAFDRVGDTASGWGAIPLLRQPHVLLSELFFTGIYAFFPNFAFVLIGMWIGRQDLSSRRLRTGLMVVGLAMAVVGYGSGWSTESHRVTVARSAVQTDPLPDEPSLWWEPLNAHGHSQMPAWMVGSSGLAMAVIGGSLVVGDRARRVVLPLARVGQLALSLYVFQVALYRWPMKHWPWGFSQAQETGLTFASFLVCIGACWLWRSRFAHGPLELLLRLAGGRTLFSGTRRHDALFE